MYFDNAIAIYRQRLAAEVGGDKYLLKAPAIKALTEMLQRNSNYITERYHTLCAIRDEQRSKENKMERDALNSGRGEQDLQPPMSSSSL